MRPYDQLLGVTWPEYGSLIGCPGVSQSAPVAQVLKEGGAHVA